MLSLRKSNTFVKNKLTSSGVFLLEKVIKMIDVAKIEYRIVVVDKDGKQYDVTGITSSLGWSE